MKIYLYTILVIMVIIFMMTMKIQYAKGVVCDFKI